MPPHYICNGRRHQVGPGLYRFTVEVNGRSWTYHASKGSAHEAAYKAERVAIVLARRAGLARPVIQNRNPLVTNQMNRVWHARKPATRHGRSLCRAAASGTRPIYI